MSDHITLWLEAYYDGELPSSHIKQVEAHLENCPACLAELEQLDQLSILLQRAPEPDNLISAETFTAQVRLRLPRKSAPSNWQSALRSGWQWIPVGLLGTWVFVQTAFLVSGILTWLLRLIPGADEVFSALPTNTGNTSFFGNLSNLEGSEWIDIGTFGLDMLRDGGPLGWGITINIGLTLFLGLLFMSWLASWWIQKSNGDQTLS